MSYYCCDCAEWISSNDSKMSYHNGRYIVHKWCKHDRTYRAEDQNVYGCSGFSYVRRAILTKICEILNINPCTLFNCFDDIKENYIMCEKPEKLVDYNSISAYIVKGLDSIPNKEELAKRLLNSYIIDAEANIKLHKYEEALNLYEEMVRTLHIMFDAMYERNISHNLVKIK